MIRLPDVTLAAGAAAKLAEYQDGVDSSGDYAARVAAAKTAFSARNQKANPVFEQVKQSLDEMCSGARRCVYCEDSLADEVEHIQPKDIYPEVVFAWTNYVYACGPCNGPKGNQYAVLTPDSSVPVVVARKPKAPVIPPLAGEPALIDPRREDATALMLLDVRETYRFTPLARKGTRDHERAAYTIKVLHLNDRDALTRARRAAYVDYVNFVRRYERDRDADLPAVHLHSLVGDLRRRQHPTVWREMQRQRDKIAELKELFAAVPEAVAW